MLHRHQTDPVVLQRVAIEDGGDGGGHPERNNNHADEEGLQMEGFVDGKEAAVHEKDRYLDCGDDAEI